MGVDGRKNVDPLLVSALAAGRTVADAAKLAGVSENTVYRRKRSPVFRRKVSDAQAEAVSRATALLGELGTSAAIALGNLLKADSATARLGAARAILELGTKLREAVELEQRISAVEERLAGGGRP